MGRGLPPLVQTVKKALRRSFAPAGAKQNEIVFPAACTWEKHFARSKRRIVRHRRAAEAQSEAIPFSKKRLRRFFEKGRVSLPLFSDVRMGAELPGLGLNGQIGRAHV